MHHPGLPHRRRRAEDLLAQFTLDPSSVKLVSKKPVGKGGQAYVYVVSWTNRKMAFKTPLVLTEEAQVVIYRELRTLAQVDHPNVVKVIGVVELSSEGSQGYGSSHNIL